MKPRIRAASFGLLLVTLVLSVSMGMIARGAAEADPPTITVRPQPTVENGPVFGAHIVLGSQSPPPDANLIRDLGIRTTAYWAYPGPGGAFNVSQVVQAVDEIKRQTGGLDVRVHLMPLSQAEARSLGNMFRLPANMSAYLASVRKYWRIAHPMEALKNSTRWARRT